MNLNFALSRPERALSRLVLGRLLSSSSQAPAVDSVMGTLDKATKVTKAKAQRVPVVIKEEDISEQFVRGSGPGGQATNKTNNKVVLHYAPLNLNVTSHETRSRHLNRKIAREKLMERLDMLLNGAESKQLKRIGKEQRRKAKARRRAAEKYGQGQSAQPPAPSAGDQQGDQHSGNSSDEGALEDSSSSSSSSSSSDSEEDGDKKP